ncbi:MAG: sensor histidine kinase, partial [Chloroflexota bacterium]
LLRLHAADQQQRAFMADAAHHLKTPVTILKSSLQNLLQRPRSPAEYEAITSASLQDLERLERLLHNMLGLARLDQRRQQLDAAALAELPRVAVSETCQAALERVAPLARQAQVELRGLGLETAVWVRAEGDELEQLWVNLLENAVQQSPAGGVVAIECVAGAQAGTVRVAVRDQGSGIAAEEAPFIFERFRRGTNSRPGGFGLGLAIARSTAESCGGSIEVTPSPCGAIFQVQLPTVP